MSLFSFQNKSPLTRSAILYKPTQKWYVLGIIIKATWANRKLTIIYIRLEGKHVKEENSSTRNRYSYRKPTLHRSVNS